MAAAQAEEAEVQYEEEEEQGGGGSTLITEVSEGRWQSALLENVFLFLSLSFFLFRLGSCAIDCFLVQLQSGVCRSTHHPDC